MAIYYKTNLSAGAPVLYGAAGSLIGVLDYCLVTTAGWTKTNTGTNLATYKAPSGRGFHIAIDDTTTTYARLRGFDATTPTAAGVAEASGVGAFPTDTQLNGGVYIYKSATSDSSTARPWRFASDGLMFHLSITPSTYGSLFSFGDFISNKGGDLGNVLLMGESSPSGYVVGATVYTQANSVGAVGNYLAKDYTNLTSSKQCGKVVDGSYGQGSNTVIGGSGASFPSVVEGGLLVSRVNICEGIAGYGFRGRIPGIWAPMHTRPIADLDTFTGTGDLTGRTFVAWNVASSGQVFIETSDTWRT